MQPGRGARMPRPGVVAGLLGRPPQARHQREARLHQLPHLLASRARVAGRCCLPADGSRQSGNDPGNPVDPSATSVLPLLQPEQRKAISTPHRLPRGTASPRQSLQECTRWTVSRIGCSQATERRCTASTTRTTGLTSTQRLSPKSTASWSSLSHTCTLRGTAYNVSARSGGIGPGVPVLQQEERQPLLHRFRGRKGPRAGQAVEKSYSLDGVAFHVSP